MLPYIVIKITKNAVDAPSWKLHILFSAIQTKRGIKKEGN